MCHRAAMNGISHTDTGTGTGTGLSYTGVALDRAGARRPDKDWIESLLDQPGVRIVPVWRNRNLVTGLGDPEGPRSLVLTDKLARNAIDTATETVFLGLDADTGVFAVDLTHLEESEAPALVGGGAFEDLRRFGPLLGQAEAAMLAYGRGMITWHRNHRFCGRCGGPMESRHGGHLRCCIRTNCGHESYPRTDPTVIMVVEHIPEDGGPPRCLLGRQANWPEGSYSTLAGFVEPGESLEETVVREIAEETGVRVDNVRYIASQPWPFPASIMLGFWARADTTEIRIDPNELEDAGWYTAAEVRTFGQWGSGGPGPNLPRKDSIARFLIERWLEAVDG